MDANILKNFAVLNIYMFNGYIIFPPDINTLLLCFASPDSA